MSVRPALRVCALVTQVKDVVAGDTVGYGGEWVATQRTRVATVAAGYADGVDRRNGNRGAVIAAGTVCPIIGRISMDQLSIDVSEAGRSVPGTRSRSSVRTAATGSTRPPSRPRSAQSPTRCSARCRSGCPGLLSTPTESEMSRMVRIAVAQYAPTVGDVEANRAAAVSWAMRAAAEGVDLLVLPELASSGYVFELEAEAAASAEDAEHGELVDALTAVCAGGMHIVVGINERAGSVRHNSAVVVGPQGHLATYRKLHLFNDEKSWFEPGGELPVVDLPFGRIGMVVCFDLWFPEAARALALAGAEIDRRAHQLGRVLPQAGV